MITKEFLQFVLVFALFCANAYCNEYNKAINGTIDSFTTEKFSPNDTIYALKVTDNGKIIIGGRLNSYGGVKIYNLLILNRNGKIDSDFKNEHGNIPSTNGSVYAIDTSSIREGKKSSRDKGRNIIAIGGSFNKVNGIDYNGLALLTENGETVSTFRTEGGIDEGAIYKIEICGNSILFSGSFSFFNKKKHPAMYIARLTGESEGFNPYLNTNQSIYTFYITDNARKYIEAISKLDFSNYRWKRSYYTGPIRFVEDKLDNSATSRGSSYNNSSRYAYRKSDNDRTQKASLYEASGIYVGGNFQYLKDESGRDKPAKSKILDQNFLWNFRVDEEHRNSFSLGHLDCLGYVRSFNAKDENRNDKYLFRPNPREKIFTMSLLDNFLYVGGSFGFALVDIKTQTGKIWEKLVGEVYTILKLDNDLVLIGGRFSIKGTKYKNLIALDADTLCMYDFIGGNPDKEVRALYKSSDYIYVGGSFNKVGNLEASKLFRFKIIENN